MCCVGCQGHVLQWTFSCLPQHVGSLLTPLQRPSWLSFCTYSGHCLQKMSTRLAKTHTITPKKWKGMFTFEVACRVKFDGAHLATHTCTHKVRKWKIKKPVWWGVRHAVCAHVFRALPHISLSVRFSFHQRSLLSPKKLWALLSTFLPFSNLSIIMWALSNLKWPFPCTGFHYGS